LAQIERTRRAPHERHQLHRDDPREQQQIQRDHPHRHHRPAVPRQLPKRRRLVDPIPDTHDNLTRGSASAYNTSVRILEAMNNAANNAVNVWITGKSFAVIALIKVRPIPGIPKYTSTKIDPVITNGSEIMIRVMI